MSRCLGEAQTDQFRVAKVYHYQALDIHGGYVHRSSVCLTEDTLTEYLEGSLDLAIKTASEVHLIVCDVCRGKLGFFMRMLDEEVDNTETTAVEAVTERWTKTNREIPRRTGTLPKWLFG